MHRVAELLRERRARVVAAEVRVVRLVAVRAPVALDLAGVHVDDRDAVVAVAVGHVGFVGLLVERDLRDLVERPHVVAAGARVGEAELLDELAVLRELQDVAVVGAVAADEQVALAVGRDAVVRLGPLVALAGTAPRAHEVAFGDRTRDRRRRHAALGRGRIRRWRRFPSPRASPRRGG